jgi:hypothetical protein
LLAAELVPAGRTLLIVYTPIFFIHIDFLCAHDVVPPRITIVEGRLVMFDHFKTYRLRGNSWCHGRCWPRGFVAQSTSLPSMPPLTSDGNNIVTTS